MFEYISSLSFTNTWLYQYQIEADITRIYHYASSSLSDIYTGFSCITTTEYYTA